MKQRIFAILLVVALLVTVGAVAVFAEETVACPVHDNCTETWQDWTYGSGTYVTEGGHYCLTADITDVTSQIRIGKESENITVDVVLDLKGFDITATTRVFYISAGSTLTIIDSVGDGVLTGAYADSGSGGAIYVSTGTADAITEFNMYGGTINSTDSAKKTGGTLYLSAYSNFNMYGGTLNSAPGFSGANGPCIYIASSNTTVNVSGGQINGCGNTSSTIANRGGAIYMTGNKTTTVLNISGDAVINGGGSSRGGTVYAQKGTINITGGTVSGGSASATGSAFCLDTGNVVFNMSGGTISSANDTTGTIWAGYTSSSGTATYPTVNITGGEVAGKILVVGGVPVTLSGAAVIDDLDLSSATAMLAFADDGLTDGARIGITKNAGEIFTEASEQATTSAKYFAGASSHMDAVTDETGALMMRADWCEICDKSVTWAPWDGGTSTMRYADANEGHYYLTKTLTTAGQVYIGQNAQTTGSILGPVCNKVCVDMYGYSIENGGINRRAFVAYNGSTLNLINTIGVSNITTGYVSSGNAINLDGESNLNLYDGIVFHHEPHNSKENNSRGGNIQVNTGKFVMYGSTLNGPTTYGVGNGGAVYVAGGSFEMHGGTINGGLVGADNGGGAVYIYTGATFDMYGGTINGSDVILGGSLYVTGGTFNMFDGTIQGGCAEEGGNIYIAANSTVNISGGTITGGEASKYGGNFRITNSSGTTVTISEEALITEGVCTYSSTATTAYGGGNIFNQAKLIITGGTISNGVSDAKGDNIFNRESGKLEISGGKILTHANELESDSIAIRGGSTGYVTISGGEIDGEIRPVLAAYPTVTLSGDPTIANLNLSQYVVGDETITPAITLGSGENGLVEGASITVNANTGVAFTAADAENENIAESSKGYFNTAENDDRDVAVLNNQLILLRAARTKICEHCGSVEWKDLTTAVKTGNVIVKDGYNGLVSGHYYLGEDYTASERMVLNGGASTEELCLDLNGHTYDISANVMPFWVRNTGANLAIMDSSNGNGKLIGKAGKGYGGGVVRVTGGAQFDLYGGVLEYKAPTTPVDDGGVVFLASSTFNMYDGTLTGGKTTGFGGAVYASGGILNIESGTINAGDSADGENYFYIGSRFTELQMSEDWMSDKTASTYWSGKVRLAVAADWVITDGVGLGYPRETNDSPDTYVWYATLAEVLQGYETEAVSEEVTHKNFIVMLNSSDVLELGDGSYFVDINGIENANSLINSNGTVYWMDTANNDFDQPYTEVQSVEQEDGTFVEQEVEVEDDDTCGYITLTDTSDLASYYKAPNGMWYITVKDTDDQYSFHCLEMQFTAMSLRTSVGGVYFDAVWNADDVLAGDLSDGVDYDPTVLAYGIALTKGENNYDFLSSGAWTYFDCVEGVENLYLCNNRDKEMNSCLLSNIVKSTNSAEVNRANATTMINACPYVIIKDYNDNHVNILGGRYSNTYQGIVEYAVEYTNGLKASATKTELEGELTEFYNTWCADPDYGLNEYVNEANETVEFFEGLSKYAPATDDSTAE